MGLCREADYRHCSSGDYREKPREHIAKHCVGGELFAVLMQLRESLPSSDTIPAFGALH